MYDNIEHFLPLVIRNNQLLYKLIAETVGTCLLVVIGVGAVCASVVASSAQGLWQVSSVFGIGVALSIYISASVSGGHLNPAVSLGLAVFRPKKFPWGHLLPYWAAQMLGGTIGGFLNYRVYYDLIETFESKGRNGQRIIRGEALSVYSAMIFGEYFPNPTLQLLKSSRSEAKLEFDTKIIPPSYALWVEIWGTCVLFFVILFVTDSRQKLISERVAPVFIGLTVASLISLYGPITQAGFNPARDFGPRIVAAFAGWGTMAIPGPRKGFWVYILGPLVGSLVGGFMFDFLIGPGLTQIVRKEESLLNRQRAEQMMLQPPVSARKLELGPAISIDDNVVIPHATHSYM